MRLMVPVDLEEDKLKAHTAVSLLLLLPRSI